MRLVGTWSWRASSAALMWSSARCSPGCMGSMADRSFLVVVHEFDIGGAAGAGEPFEADTVLVFNMDADALLAFSIALERFETIAGERCEVLQNGCGFEPVQLEPCGPLEAGKV